jgi:hypothetical protein
MFLKKSLYLILCVLLSLGCSNHLHVTKKPSIPVEGALFGRPFQTHVDHELAKTMLTNPNDSSVIQLFSTYRTRKINTETLTEISKKYSADVSTLFFVEKM